MINALTILGLGLSTATTASTDWSKYLGPSGTGKTESVDADFDWSEGGPEIVWRVEIGPGYGGAAVRDGEVYLLDREVGERDVMRVFDLENGEEKWNLGYEAPGRLDFAGSRTVPSVQEKRIYTQGGFGQVTCFDRESHEVVWTVDLGEVYGGEMPGYGWVASPLVLGDIVVVAALGEDVGLVGLNAATGEDLWVTPPVGGSHSTPVLMNLLGMHQIVFLSTSGGLSGAEASAPMTISSFDPGSGMMLWQTVTELTRLPIPVPVQVDENRFFVTGGYRGGSTLMRIAHEEGEFAFEELFHIDRGAQVQSPLLLGEHLYVLVNENWTDTRPRRKEGGLLCLGLDGKEAWRTADDPYFGRGNAVLAGEHLLIQDGKTGVLRVVRATPEGYQEVASADLFDTEDRGDHRMWAPMAVAGGLLLLRSQEELLCVRL